MTRSPLSRLCRVAVAVTLAFGVPLVAGAAPASAALKPKAPVAVSTGVTLHGVTLHGVTLHGVTLHGVTLHGVTLHGETLNGVTLH